LSEKSICKGKKPFYFLFWLGKKIFKIDANMISYEKGNLKEKGISKGRRYFVFCVLFIENNFMEGQEKKFGLWDLPNFT